MCTRQHTPPAPAPPKVYRSAAVLHGVVSAGNLITHITGALAGDEIWWSEPVAYLPATQYHEAYATRGWWSYPTASRTGGSKFSIYQFRDPGEEFSELYATYHCASPKGSTTPAAFKTWFEANNLHADPP